MKLFVFEVIRWVRVIRVRRFLRFGFPSVSSVVHAFGVLFFGV
ncbi:hypothetical protein GEOBRER4_n1788 [Citrifermentans bremense]|uniref:Uncharacterized protein n=1 Tax=Citrifermentans bremense TaxID=60035 RepID=A0A7R7FTC2_9BACT|nr:hypothetical protein GEOBRER4_n1788 [Citrifermentans bremense]